MGIRSLLLETENAASSRRPPTSTTPSSTVRKPDVRPAKRPMATPIAKDGDMEKKKSRILVEHGIEWRSPAVMNPHVLFD